MKRINYLYILVLAVVLAGAYFYIVRSGESTDDFSVDIGTGEKFIYGHITADRDFKISVMALPDGNQVASLELKNVFTRRIFLDELNSQLWIPVEYEKDLKTISNLIYLIDLKTGDCNEIRLGLTAKDVHFFDNRIAVTCLERGIRDVTTYILDRSDTTLLNKIVLGGDTCEFVAADTKQNRLYVVSENVDYKVSYLITIDVENCEMVNKLEFPGVPLHGVCVVDNTVWVVGGHKLFVVDSNSFSILESHDIEWLAYQLESHQGQVVVSHYYPEVQQQLGVSLIDPKTREILHLDIGDIVPSHFVLKGSTMYIVDSMAGKLHLFDLSKREIIETVELGRFPTNVVLLSGVENR